MVASIRWNVNYNWVLWLLLTSSVVVLHLHPKYYFRLSAWKLDVTNPLFMYQCLNSSSIHCFHRWNKPKSSSSTSSLMWMNADTTSAVWIMGTVLHYWMFNRFPCVFFTLDFLSVFSSKYFTTFFVMNSLQIGELVFCVIRSFKFDHLFFMRSPLIYVVRSVFILYNFVPIFKFILTENKVGKIHSRVRVCYTFNPNTYIAK